jgi:putative intracellular protease/amidase/YHS domain-containing protein
LFEVEVHHDYSCGLLDMDVVAAHAATLADVSVSVCFMSLQGIPTHGHSREMKRRDFLNKSAMVGAAASLSLLTEKALSLTRNPDPQTSKGSITVPAPDPINVAFVISQGAVIIDFCGPWEVFQDTNVPGRKGPYFNLYTVAESMQPVRASAGMQIVPDYTFDTAPAPKIIVIPAQRGQTDAMLNWIRKASKTSDLTMSVCIGANVLAATGLLAGRPATTHHNSYNLFASRNPDIKVKRGVRFVDDGNIASAGGLSSGIDLALHVVERYFGKEAAVQTAYYLEYLGDGWKNPDVNSMYKETPAASGGMPRCAVCGMEVDTNSAPKTTFHNKVYYFCTNAHKTLFEQTPRAFAGEGA